MRSDSIVSSSLRAQCWISSVTGLLNLQGDEIQKTGLRRSESSGSWNCPERLAPMLIRHSSIPTGRLPSGTWSLNPYPSHWKQVPWFGTVNAVSPITSTPRIQPENVYYRSWLNTTRALTRQCPSCLTLQGWYDGFTSLSILKCSLDAIDHVEPRELAVYDAIWLVKKSMICKYVKFQEYQTFRLYTKFNFLCLTVCWLLNV